MGEEEQTFLEDNISQIDMNYKITYSSGLLVYRGSCASISSGTPNS